MPHLFEPLTVRSITLRNRIGVSPMCMYSAEDGIATDWHLVHLGARAAGGAGLVIVEATAVLPEGRISPGDLGLWSDAQVEPLARINRFIKSQGSVPGLQLAHAGRKASTARPWQGGGHLLEGAGGWQTVAPSPLPFGGDLNIVPRALTAADIDHVHASFVAAAQRALASGCEWMELHCAHGYLAHQFLSPISNARTDRYGGTFENRIRFVLELTRGVRTVWPEHLPLTARFSCTDWVDGGWNIEEMVDLAKRLKNEGVDLIDCSSGGTSPTARVPVGAGYQVPFAERVRRSAGILTAAVGMITEPMQADQIVRNGQADMVLVAREMLRDPNWALHAARTLHLPVSPPQQYLRAW